MVKVADKEEMLKVLDEDGNETGKYEKRSVVHDKEIFHREVVLWLIDKDDRQVLFQRRSHDKKAWPDKFGLVAGHVVGDDSIEDAVITEAKEEIGVDIRKFGFKHFFTYKKQEKNNYCYVYHFYSIADIPLSKLKIQEEELTEVKYVDYDEYKEAVHKRKHDYVLKWNEKYEEMFEFLDKIFNE